MISELLDELKMKIMTGETSSQDIDVVNEAMETIDVLQKRLEVFQTESLDESREAMLPLGGTIIENVNVYIFGKES